MHRVVLVEKTASHNARLGILLEISQHSFDGFGIDHSVVVENEDVSARRSSDALIASGSHAAIFGIGYDRNLGKRLFEHLQRAVGRAVVDHYHLMAYALDGRHKRAEATLQHIALIPGEDDYR